MVRVAELRTAHTADLGDGTRSAIRDLLDATFSGFTDAAFENGLGGMHALLLDGTALIGHASVVARRLLYDGRALRAGYVETVAVREDRRRQGHGHTMMAALERVIGAAYDLGTLGASADGAALYTARGWLRWQGPLSAMTPDGIRRTADFDGAIYVLPLSLPLDVSRELACDWRDGNLW
jgi:aminoglycoside 2'-N-acetyltransferase I